MKCAAHNTGRKHLGESVGRLVPRHQQIYRDKGGGGAAEEKWPRGMKEVVAGKRRDEMQAVDGDVLLHSTHGLVSAQTVHFSSKLNQLPLLLLWNL